MGKEDLGGAAPSFVSTNAYGLLSKIKNKPLKPVKDKKRSAAGRANSAGNASKKDTIKDDHPEREGKVLVLDMNAPPPARPKKEEPVKDRQSRTGRGTEVSKDGQGKGGWGHKDTAPEEPAPQQQEDDSWGNDEDDGAAPAATTEATSGGWGEEDTTVAAEKSASAEPTPAAEEEKKEPEKPTMTMEEYKAQQAGLKIEGLPEKQVRSVDTSKLKKMTVLKKSQDEKLVVTAAPKKQQPPPPKADKGKDKGKAKQKEPQAPVESSAAKKSDSTKHTQEANEMASQLFRMAPRPRPPGGRGGEGGRGGGRGGRGGRGYERNYNQQQSVP
eukprot:288194_1